MSLITVRANPARVQPGQVALFEKDELHPRADGTLFADAMDPDQVHGEDEYGEVFIYRGGGDVKAGMSPGVQKRLREGILLRVDDNGEVID